MRRRRLRLERRGQVARLGQRLLRQLAERRDRRAGRVVVRRQGALVGARLLHEQVERVEQTGGRQALRRLLVFGAGLLTAPDASQIEDARQ